VGKRKDHNNQVINYESEDDKKVLCLMVDERVVNFSSIIIHISHISHIYSNVKVEVRINGDLVPIQMKVGNAGEAFFVIKTDVRFPKVL
jgi:phosphatidate phosphatase PAH1